MSSARALTESGAPQRNTSYREFHDVFYAHHLLDDVRLAVFRSDQHLARVYKHLGGAQAGLKQLGEGIESYQAALAIEERLAAADPGNPQIRIGISFDLNDIGVIHMIRGERPAALEYYRKALAIRESLVAADSKDARVRHALGNSHERIGDLLSDMGQTSDALEHFRKTLECREELVRMDPANNSNQVALADAYEHIGYVYAALARSKCRRELWSEAKSWYQKSLAAFQALAARGALRGSEAEAPARLKDNLAECEAALGRVH